MPEGVKRFVQCVYLVLVVTFSVPASSYADARRDSLDLFGAWKWAHSEGGLSNAVATSAPGCSLMLYLHRDGHYAFWERDSLGNNLLCHGRFTVHRMSELGYKTSQSIWVDLAGWIYDYDGRQIVQFEGPDKITTRPGGGNVSVEDAGTTTYVRRLVQREPSVPRNASNAPGKPRHSSVLVWPKRDPTVTPAQLDSVP